VHVNIKTYSLLLGCSLLLGSGLLLGCCLLGCCLLAYLLLVFGTELVRALDLDKVTVSYGILQGCQESFVQPFLILGKVGLHVLLDSNGGGSGTVLEGGDGFEDSCFVRHDDSGWMLLICCCNDIKFREDERGLVHVI